jgi:murein DD-endopeptidase MepM/ murein hydrolase activator NlpD
MNKFLRVFLIGLGLLVFSGALAARASGSEYVFDVRGGQSLVMLVPSRELAVRQGASLSGLGLPVYSARFLPDGDIAAIDIDFALWRIGPAGRAEWLPPGSANAPLFVSPDGTRLAYTKPADFEDGSTFPLTSGIAVLDLASGHERLLLEVPGLTLGLYGWLGDDLVIHVPAWDPATLQPAPTLTLARLPADGSGPPERLAELPRLDATSVYPQTSFDQRFISYESPAGVVVASLADAAYAEYAGRSEPLWTAEGLTTAEAGERQLLAWAEHDVSLQAAASGALPVPSAAALPAHDTELPESVAPQSATAILFYRPVAATVRVSAYFDLNRTIGIIEDWLGWVGSQWIPGRAYDQHLGTDYAAPERTPVYASATGTVDVVRIQCGNYYQGGPAGFGTYVRINHGLLSDGNFYRTLYGHLRCDGVHTVTGTVVSTLPHYLAEMGNTGTSTGPHVHLEVYRNGASIDPYFRRIISDNPSIRITGDLSGAVLNRFGQPASGALLKLGLGGYHRATIIGPDGQYRFTDVPGGSAGLTAVSGRRWGAVPATVLADQSVSAADIVLDRCLAGVTAADGCPATIFDAAAFVADITIPDGMTVTAGLPLTKTWRLRNTGTSTWGAGYQLVFVAGEKMPGAPAAIGVTPAAPGQTADLTYTMQAPAGPGTYRSYWRLRSPQGVYFGPTIWVDVRVISGAGGASAPAALSSPACAITGLPAQTASTSFPVQWSDNGSGATAYDVQFLESQRGIWRPWLGQVPAARKSADFNGQVGRFYHFRCRASAGEATGAWSEAVMAFVTQAAGSPDLHILSLSAEPGPGGGLLATLVVRNQGSAGTGNGFYADLYYDRQPAGPGDYAGSVHQWVSEPLAPGATVTLTAGLKQLSGTRNVTLYAQVDSTNVVAESNEGNNIAGGLSACIAAVDAFEDDDSPAAASLLPPGASQARNFGWPGDKDWMRLELQPNRFYLATTSGLAGGVDTRLTVYAPNATTVITANDDSGGTLASRVGFVTRFGAGPYYLLAENWNPAAGGCGASYSVSLADLGSGHTLFFPVIYRGP